MSLPPGPPLPSSVQMALWVARPLWFMDTCARSYGDAFTLRLGGIGDFVILSSPAAIKEVFTGDPDVLQAGQGNAILAPLLGPGSLLLLDGEAHLRERRLLLPPFHGERMQAYAREMRDIAEASIDRWPLGTPFSLAPRMRAITLEVILRTVFGLEIEGQADELRRLHRLLSSLLDMLSGSWRLVPVLLGIDLFKLLPFAPSTRLLQRVNRELHAEIARRRARADGTRTDVLSLLLSARHEDGRPLGDDELRDELVTLLVAGHETTAIALSWAVERILATPEVRARLEDELHAVVGAGPLEPAQLARLDYLEAVCKETLRMRPIVPVVQRRLAAPLEVAGYHLPAGTYVTPSILLTHRRPDLYPEPDAFRPERFLGKKVDPYAWLPFGGGTRRCLGMAFALYEMKVVLATSFLRARLERAPGPPVGIVRRGITLSPARGTPVVLRARENLHASI